MLEEMRQIQIEQPVIGSLLLWPEKLRDRLTELEEEDFTVCGGLFALLREGAQAGLAWDSTLFLSRLMDQDLKDLAILCMESVVTQQHFDEYLSELKVQSRQRRLKRSLQELLLRGGVETEDLQKLVEGEARRDEGGQAMRRAMETMRDFCGRMDRPREVIYTGFPALDRALGGLRLPSLCYIGARPSTGKTTLALNIAAAQSGRVLFISLEMAADMLYERMAANALDLDYAAIQNQRLKSADKDKMRAYFEKLYGQERFFVLDDVYTIEGISAAAARLRPALVVVDYLQKVGTLQRLPNLRERTEYISGELKRIAKYGHCCVIALSQVSRAGREAPTMSDLKESGALEADGDYILLAHRPYAVSYTHLNRASAPANVGGHRTLRDLAILRDYCESL